jgi:hypothetical protein
MSVSAEPEAPVVDAQVVSDGDGLENAAGEVPGSALVHHVASQSDVMRPVDPEALVESFKEYVALRGKLLTPDDYQSAGGGKQFVKKSGWRKIATAFGLNLELVKDQVERDESGQVVRASVVARAIAPNGRFADGDGHCSVEEERFSGPRGNKSKLENDLRGTAATRATNRAVSNLVGMGEVSAEEVGEQEQQGPPNGPPASSNLENTLATALTFLFGGDESHAAFVIGEIARVAGGYVPSAAAQAVVLTIKHKKETDGNAGSAGDALRGPAPGADVRPGDGGSDGADESRADEGAGAERPTDE